MTSESPSRRDVLKTAAAVTAAAALSPFRRLAAAEAPTSAAQRPAQTPALSPAKREGARAPACIGIATSVAPLAGADLERTLDDMQQRAGVNAVFPFVYTHVPNRAGVAAGSPFHGGNYAMPHMQYYRDALLTFEDMRGTEFGDIDLFERLIPAARKRGMKTFAWIIEDNRRGPGPRWEQLYEIDFHGRRAPRHPGGPCYNNPHYRAYLLGLVEDYARSYQIDGVMWGSERQGGLLNALGLYHNGARADPAGATCFCEFCLERARKEGIDAERARRGFAALEQFVRAGRAKQRPRDGWFVDFWRLLLQFPELLAWENLWVRSRHDVQVALHRTVKSINPALPVGWHMWHNVSFSPFHRAEEDYAEFPAFSDFIRPVLYNNCAGERMHSFVDSAHGNVLGDLPEDDALQFLYHVLDYSGEARFDRVSAAGFSPDYVERETRRTVEAVAGSSTQVWPGIDIDAPTAAGSSKCTPESVRQTVHAVFRGGASGILLSRNYVEMKPENLAAAGAALRELHVV